MTVSQRDKSRQFMPFQKSITWDGFCLVWRSFVKLENWMFNIVSNWLANVHKQERTRFTKTKTNKNKTKQHKKALLLYYFILSLCSYWHRQKTILFHTKFSHLQHSFFLFFLEFFCNFGSFSLSLFSVFFFFYLHKTGFSWIIWNIINSFLFLSKLQNEFSRTHKF